MNTLVDFNAAKHTFKHGKKKEDATQWMTLKEVAQYLGTSVPRAKAIIQNAVAHNHLKTITKHSAKGVQVMYAIAMIKELRDLYTAGAVKGVTRFPLFRMVPSIGQGLALFSIGRTIYNSTYGKAIVEKIDAKLEIGKWERKAEVFVDSLEHKVLTEINTRFGTLPKSWVELRTLAESKITDLITRKFKTAGDKTANTSSDGKVLHA